MHISNKHARLTLPPQRLVREQDEILVLAPEGELIHLVRSLPRDGSIDKPLGNQS